MVYFILSYNHTSQISKLPLHLLRLLSCMMVRKNDPTATNVPMEPNTPWTIVSAGRDM